MVLEHRGEYPSLRAAIDSMAANICCVPQTLRTSVKRHEVYSRVRDGHHVEVQRLKQLERENKELRKANEISKLASAFFARAKFVAV